MKGGNVAMVRGMSVSEIGQENCCSYPTLGKCKDTDFHSGLRDLTPRLLFILHPLSIILYPFFPCRVLVLLLPACLPRPAAAGTLTVDLGKSEGVTFVGRGPALGPPGQSAPARRSQGEDRRPDGRCGSQERRSRPLGVRRLPPGKYDLVILAGPRLRIEGWQYAPVKEFDPFFPPTATTDDETRDFITDDIAKSPHYENKLVAACHGRRQEGGPRAGDVDTRQADQLRERQPRGGHHAARDMAVFLELRRLAEGAAHPRAGPHFAPRDELRKWTWLWDPKLGGIEVTSQDATIKYELPSQAGLKKLRGCGRIDGGKEGRWEGRKVGR